MNIAAMTRGIGIRNANSDILNASRALSGAFRLSTKKHTKPAIPRLRLLEIQIITFSCVLRPASKNELRRCAVKSSNVKKTAHTRSSRKPKK